MVTLSIDGKTIEVAEGTTVLRAAQGAGIDIPTLCDHPHLTPYGGCRLCLVEMEGARTLQPSCTMPVMNNMVIKTNSKKVLDARKFVLTLIFSERNHFCPYCQVSGGDCELQNAAYHEGMTHWPLQPNWKPFPVDASHPYIILENNRCILCRRCVRACSELIGNNTLGFEERGAKSMLVADTGVPLGESTCISCGSCAQVCPTGALIDRWSAYLGHEVSLDSTNTICVGCSIGCGLKVLTRNNNLIRIEGDWDAKLNEGVICEVGRFLPMIDKCDRIHTPLIKKNDALKASTWDEAYELITNKLKLLKGKSRDGIAALISSRQSIESIYSFKQLFQDYLGSELVTTTEEGSFTRATSELAKSIGKPFESKLTEIDKSDGVLVFNTDLVKDHQVAGFFIKRNLANGTGLLVIDREENGLDLFANKTLKPAKVSMEKVILGVMSAIVKLGLSKGSSSIKVENLDDIAEQTGFTTDDYLDAAYIIGSAERPVIVYEADDNLSSLRALSQLINAKLVSVKGTANSLAAAQFEMEKQFKADDYQAIFIALGDGNISQKLLQEIEKVPFKIVLSSYSNALTAGADIVLPSTIWLEQGGHFINNDGTVQEAFPSLKPADEITSISSILTKLSEKMNYKLETVWTKEIHKKISPVEISK